MEKATFGAGCFWCVEAIFKDLKGVEKVVSGYTGGSIPNPSYEQVCSGNTGHAEVAQLTYDPDVITFQDLLEVFWKTHDPTTKDQQGADHGTQYRSAIFYHSDVQRQIAEEYKTQLNASDTFTNPIVTEISPMGKFYPAENYHQDYFKNNPGQPYCKMVVRPKVEKFKAVFSDRLK